MKTKLFFAFFITMMAVLGMSRFAIAVTTGPDSVSSAPSPYCQITADVMSVDRKSAVSEMAPEIINEYYSVNLNISEISNFQQEGDRLCDNNYLEVVKNSGFILSLDEYDVVPVFPGQRIKGVIHFSGDEFFSGYRLASIEILDDQTNNLNLSNNELNLNIPLIEMGRASDRQIINWYYVGPLAVVAILLLVCIITVIKLLKR